MLKVHVSGLSGLFDLLDVCCFQFNFQDAAGPNLKVLLNVDKKTCLYIVGGHSCVNTFQ